MNVYVDKDIAVEGDGSEWDEAKKTLQAGYEVLKDSTDAFNYLYVRSDLTSPIYNDNLVINGFSRKVNLFIEPRSYDESTQIWNTGHFQNKEWDPTKGADTGDYDPRSMTRPVTLAGSIQIVDSGTVALHGFAITGSVLVNLHALMGGFQYCHFQNNNASLTVLADSNALIEGCCFTNTVFGVTLNNRAFLIMDHDNYFVDPVGGAARFLSNSLVHIKQSCELYTTQPTGKDWYGFKITEHSRLKLWEGADEDYSQNDNHVGHLAVINEMPKIMPGYKGILLESGAMLQGAKRLLFVTQNLKGEPVPMPIGNTICMKANSNVTVIE